MTETITLIHAAATWFMVGLIWFVQVVHYPLFGAVDGATWPRYAERHRRQTTWIVLPVMLVELALTIALVIRLTSVATITGAALLALVWVSTFAIQVPRHTRLGVAHDPLLVRSLVVTNWLRTAAWSGRGLIALHLIAAA